MNVICLNKSKVKIIVLLVIIFIIDFSYIKIQSHNIKISEYEKELLSKYNDKKLLVLTFDDGPSKYTTQLLEILKKENIKATFFVLGEKVEKNQDIIASQYEDGHIIGIHSYKHVFFTKISDEEIREQISKTSDLITDVTNVCPTYIRVPYGIINARVKNILKECNLENILWTVDSLDWNYKNTQKTVSHVITTTHGNDIILMHDTYKTTIEAVEQIIKYYKEKGYVFVSINEFYKIKNLSKSLS